MGFFSFLCKECGHPLLCAQAADKGINDWMTQAVVLTPRGSRLIGEYDGYGSVGGCDDLDNAACLHKACWELAGKPEWSYYDSVSEYAPDQGFFFDDGAHDMIDPRIKYGREDLLRKGIEARTQARFDARARDVSEWINEHEYDDKEPWENRFSYGRCYKDGKRLEGKFYLTDRWDMLSLPEAFDGTEAEVRAVLAKHWDEFTKSDYCSKLLARAVELRGESRLKYLENLKAIGRYEVGYGVSRTGGDLVDGRKVGCQKFYVRDNMTYENVVEFDYEGTPREFVGDPDYPGNHSPEWEARVEENRADARARRAKADAEAARLNAEWAAKGYPAEGLLAG